jgi:mRNA-degrading endonuclease RelE of RelBE toxin-antitoxin system
VNAISWTRQAMKQLRRIDAQYHAEIITGVDTLAHMPGVPNVRALVKHRYGYRLRVGNFRVLFDWHGAIRVVEVQEIKKRNEQTY